jgi:hypothetical protein
MPMPVGGSRRTIAKRNLGPAFIHSDRPGFVQKVKTITAPPPLFGCADQAPLDRIAMHIPQFLHALLRGPHVEVVEAGLPERRAQNGIGNRRGWRASTRFFLGNKARAVRCFNTCMTVDGVPTSGSVMSRWICSGMTTYPTTTKR